MHSAVRDNFQEMDSKFMILKIKLTPGVHLSLLLGYIHDHTSQTGLLVYITDLR